MLIFFVNYQHSAKLPIPKNEVSYGFSFAPHPFTAAGLNWRKSYTDLLDRFNWKWVRISFYWDQMVNENEDLKLDDLVFQIEEAQKRNIDIVLAIGAKAPYHPEIYIPKDLTKKLKYGQDIGTDENIKKALLKIDKQIVEKLATFSAIAYWQIENEPFAGTRNNWKVGQDLLKEEIRVVKKNDSQKRPIILSHPGPFIWDKSWQDLIPLLQPGDVFAINYFPKTRTPDVINIHLFSQDLKIRWPDVVNIPVYIWGPISPDFVKVRKAIENNGNKLWIMEMQAEPYLSEFREARGKIFVYTPSDILKSDKAIREAGIDHIGLWGANWWLLAEKNGNSDWINTVEKVVGKRQTSN